MPCLQLLFIPKFESLYWCSINSLILKEIIHQTHLDNLLAPKDCYHLHISYVKGTKVISRLVLYVCFNEVSDLIYICTYSDQQMKEFDSHSWDMHNLNVIFCVDWKLHFVGQPQRLYQMLEVIIDLTVLLKETNTLLLIAFS